MEGEKGGNWGRKERQAEDGSVARKKGIGKSYHFAFMRVRRRRKECVIGIDNSFVEGMGMVVCCGGELYY